MTRLFETQSDLKNEQEIVEILSKHWGFDFHKLDRRYQADFMATKDGELRLWVEIKCRNLAKDDWPDIILELDKSNMMWQLSLNTGVPAIFVVRFTDAIGWIKIAPPFKIKYVNYNDRYNVNGSPCVILQLNQFTFLE